MSEQERAPQQRIPLGGAWTLEERERHAARAAAGLPPLGGETPIAAAPAPVPQLPPIDEDEAADALFGPEAEEEEGLQ